MSGDCVCVSCIPLTARMPRIHCSLNKVLAIRVFVTLFTEMVRVLHVYCEYIVSSGLCLVRVPRFFLHGAQKCLKPMLIPASDLWHILSLSSNSVPVDVTVVIQKETHSNVVHSLQIMAG